MRKQTITAATKARETRENLTGAQYDLLHFINFSEDGYINAASLNKDGLRLLRALVRKGLVTPIGHGSDYEIMLDGRYVVEPEATTEMYGPQRAEPDPFAERNFEAEAAEMRSEYRYEDDDRYQMSDAEIEYRAQQSEN